MFRPLKNVNCGGHKVPIFRSMPLASPWGDWIFTTFDKKLECLNNIVDKLHLHTVYTGSKVIISKFYINFQLDVVNDALFGISERMHQNSDPNISRYSSQQRKLNAVQPSARLAIKSNMNQQPRLTQNLQNFNTDKECDLNRPKIEISVIYNNMCIIVKIAWDTWEKRSIFQ